MNFSPTADYTLLFVGSETLEKRLNRCEHLCGIYFLLSVLTTTLNYPMMWLLCELLITKVIPQE